MKFWLETDNNMAKKQNEGCAFCGSPRTNGILLQGLSANICEHCVKQAYEVLEQSAKQQKQLNLDKAKLPKPVPSSDSFGVNLSFLALSVLGDTFLEIGLIVTPISS